MVFAKLLLSASLASSTAVDYEAVKKDIIHIMNDPSWDDGSYAALFVRLGWHSSATYNRHDGTGGSNGATMRYALEANDPQNAGLENARGVLAPLVEKYDGLTYSDLWILAAYTALEETNGPKLEFVGGRVDKPESEAIAPGRLPDAEKGYEPGLNLDSKGRLPGFEANAAEIRRVFDRLGFNDHDTVALISGGHAYGRCHKEFTGYEGTWMENALYFSNEYVTDMIGDEWHPVYADTKLPNGAYAPIDLRPSGTKRQFIDFTTIDPTVPGMLSAKMRNDDHDVTLNKADFPPGNYVINTTWVNIREGYDTQSPIIARQQTGGKFQIIDTKVVGTTVRGLASHGGWVSLRTDGGALYFDRTGDLDMKALADGGYRMIPGLQDPAPVYDKPAKGKQVDKVTAGQEFDCKTMHQNSDASLYCQLSTGKWALVYDTDRGMIAEHIVYNYNDGEFGHRVPIRDQFGHQMMLPSDMTLKWDKEFFKTLSIYNVDEDQLKEDFGKAYKRLTELGCPWSEDQPTVV